MILEFMIILQLPISHNIENYKMDDKCITNFVPILKNLLMYDLFPNDIVTLYSTLSCKLK